MRAIQVSIPETAVIAKAAKLFHRQQIRRMPVLRDGQLGGIVTRSDRLKVLANSSATPQGTGDDQPIRASLPAHLALRPWARLSTENIIESGKVHLFGFVQDDEERQAMRVAAESIPGVTGVGDHPAPERHRPV